METNRIVKQNLICKHLFVKNWKVDKDNSLAHNESKTRIIALLKIGNRKQGQFPCRKKNNLLEGFTEKKNNSLAGRSQNQGQFTWRENPKQEHFNRKSNKINSCELEVKTLRKKLKQGPKTFLVVAAAQHIPNIALLSERFGKQMASAIVLISFQTTTSSSFQTQKLFGLQKQK